MSHCIKKFMFILCKLVNSTWNTKHNTVLYCNIFHDVFHNYSTSLYGHIKMCWFCAICYLKSLKNRPSSKYASLSVCLCLSQYPKVFAGSLLDYVGSQAQYLHTLLAMTQTNKVESQQHAQRLHRAEMALEALCNVIKNNPGNSYKKDYTG